MRVFSRVCMRRFSRGLFAVLPAVWLLAGGLQARTERIHVSGTRFVDEGGGTVILRGFNVAGNAKVPDFMPIKQASMLDPLQQWGVNVIRLLFTWEAFEPQPGQYNAQYLAYIDNVIAWSAARGIHVIIDFHQDAFSRYNVGGCGEGFPAWAVPPEVSKATPNNGNGCKLWGALMISDFAMHTSWHHFYADTYGVRTRYLKMVDRVSAHFAGNAAVVGYDIMNEPWGYEITEIAVLYRDAAKLIRRNDPDTVLFVSPHALISAGGDSELPAMPFSNYVYSPHYYDGTIITLNWWWGTAPDGALNKQKKKADAWNVPAFWGEYGVDATSLGGASYMDLFYDWLDRNGASGTQWNFTPAWNPTTFDGFNAENLSVIDNRGSIRANYRIRPYPQRLAGTPGTFLVKRKSSGAIQMTLSYTHDPNGGETRIYLPEKALFGSTGYTYSISPGLSCEFDEARIYLVCTSTSSGTKSITVTSKGY